jgi:hypothetical protein
MNRKQLDRLRISPAKWPDVFDGIPPSDREAYVRELLSVAAAAVRMAGYFDGRLQGFAHDASMTISNHYATRLRKLLS